jgi:hypothetical protein
MVVLTCCLLFLLPTNRRQCSEGFWVRESTENDRFQQLGQVTQGPRHEMFGR